MRITPESRWPPHENVVARKVGDGGVLVHLATGRVFELNETGLRVWELLATGASLTDVISALLREFRADPATVDRDVRALVVAFADAGLLRP